MADRATKYNPNAPKPARTLTPEEQANKRADFVKKYIDANGGDFIFGEKRAAMAKEAEAKYEQLIGQQGLLQEAESGDFNF